MGTTRTLKEWGLLGWRVKKGSHCVGRNDAGVPVFDASQVERPPWHDGQRAYNRTYHRTSYDDPPVEPERRVDGPWQKCGMVEGYYRVLADGREEYRDEDTHHAILWREQNRGW